MFFFYNKKFKIYEKIKSEDRDTKYKKQGAERRESSRFLRN